MFLIFVWTYIHQIEWKNQILRDPHLGWLWSSSNTEDGNAVETHIGRATHFVVSGWQEMSKGGQKLQSGRLTHLVDQQICWYGWCWLAVPFVVSVPFDDKICWYGQAFRINILCNRPILLMDEQLMLGLQNQHSVQLTHFVDATDNVAEWKF